MVAEAIPVVRSTTASSDSGSESESWMQMISRPSSESPRLTGGRLRRIADGESTVIEAMVRSGEEQGGTASDLGVY